MLDNPVYSSLSNPAHSHLAKGQGRVLRYLDDVAPFIGLPDDPTEQDWHDAATLVGSGTAAYVHLPKPTPANWTVVRRLDLVQMTAPPGLVGAPDARAVRLTAADAPEMLDLARRTAPGPFLPRTVEMGTYLGIRLDGELAAMAGERMRPTGWVEISAVCTSPEHRGQGLGTALIRALLAGIAAQGDRAFLHVAATNANAIRLYEALGFTVRRELVLSVLKPQPATVC
ncbi:GNAT family N-acetyltransferase [Kutzneria sp. CA-103260]|uniref:GNAT family N-acetyltransferase n=1 Tax=Kutzneria sp. CA-103260 TaxID=2802641 RepID=UPI001BA5BA9F|nr:GNAT family N-acetyltransferase [Kutzneria sp. CA-103260]QUQ71779.1 acetyltransferase [Kutzneria sp. CA-103260]